MIDSEKIISKRDTVLFETERKQNVGYWVDSIMFLHQKNDNFLLISSPPDRYNYSLYYYNADSLSVEVIAKQKPKIETIELKNGKKVIITEDISYSFGDKVKCIFWAELSPEGALINKNTLVSTQKRGTRRFDKNINILPTADSVLVLRNDTIVFSIR